MGYQRVKSIQEMNMMNKAFWDRVKNAQIRAINRLADVNVKKSKEVVTTGLVSYSGALFSSINAESLSGNTNIRVIAVDYGEGDEKSAEIEYGLKNKTREWVAPVAELDRWRKHKGRVLGWNVPVGVIGKKEVDVNPSPHSGGVPHPKGLHYFYLGFLEVKKQSYNIIEEELNKAGG